MLSGSAAMTLGSTFLICAHYWIETARANLEHGALGSIDYHDGQPGILVYLKSSLTAALHQEPVDVIEYSMRGNDFPHQTTADQFFDESQFESYRRLGITSATLPSNNCVPPA